LSDSLALKARIGLLYCIISMKEVFDKMKIIPIDLAVKNRLLHARLTWCLGKNMVRYYPESVLVLSD